MIGSAVIPVIQHQDIHWLRKHTWNASPALILTGPGAWELNAQLLKPVGLFFFVVFIQMEIPHYKLLVNASSQVSVCIAVPY